MDARKPSGDQPSNRSVGITCREEDHILVLTDELEPSRQKTARMSRTPKWMFLCGLAMLAAGLALGYASRGAVDAYLPQLARFVRAGTQVAPHDSAVTRAGLRGMPALPREVTFRGIHFDVPLSEHVPQCHKGKSAPITDALDPDQGLGPPNGAHACRTWGDNAACLSSWAAGYRQPAGTSCDHVVFDDSLRSVMGTSGDVISKDSRVVEVRIMILPNPLPAKEMLTEKYGAPGPIAYSVQGAIIGGWQWTGAGLVFEIVENVGGDGSYGLVVRSQDWQNQRRADAAKTKQQQMKDF
jgi:hypothetical protein